MLSGIYRPQEARFNIRKMAEERGATFIEDKVVRIEAEQQSLFLGSGQKVQYDVVSFNTGSEVPAQSLMAADQANAFTVKPVINLLRARQAILNHPKRKELRCVVIGGGPAGIEISGNLWRLTSQEGHRARITLVAGRRLLGECPDKARSMALASLSSRGVEVTEGNHVSGIDHESITLRDGTRIDYDAALISVGISPSSLFKESGLPIGEDGGMLVNKFLQSTGYRNIFGGGDCICLQGNSLARVGVYAVRENPILYHNLNASLSGGGMKTFTPQKFYLLIFNLGNGRGIYWKKDWVWEGKLAFLFKDFIDRRFMRGFQVSGELLDSNTGIVSRID
jgi:NADH dehydrogenase FAD-containing subunit